MISRYSQKYPIRQKVSTRRFIRTALFFIFFVGMFLLIKVWQNVKIDEMNRKNGELRLKLDSLRYENALLESKLEELKSMERVTGLAREKLDLVNVPVLSMELSAN